MMISALCVALAGFGISEAHADHGCDWKHAREHRDDHGEHWQRWQQWARTPRPWRFSIDFANGFDDIGDVDSRSRLLVARLRMTRRLALELETGRTRFDDRERTDWRAGVAGSDRGELDGASSTTLGKLAVCSSRATSVSNHQIS